MSGPDGIDERFGTLVGELRSMEVAASPELRERVRALVERGPEPPATARFRRVPRRRLAFVLVPVAAILAAAVGVGVFTSPGTSPTRVAGVKQANFFAGQGRVDTSKTANSGSVLSHDRKVPGRLGPSRSLAPFTPHAPAPAPQQGAAGLNAYSDTPLAPSGSRAQNYEADLHLRVDDLSGTTKQAINLTRGWGGYLVSVDYGSGAKAGSAYLLLRVPIVKVQTAVAKLSSLGKILDDHVSIQDVQGQLNERFARIQALRVKIAELRAKLADTSLTASQRAFFDSALTQRQAQLVNLQQQETAQRTRASFATVQLDLDTKKAAAAAPSKPSQIGRALHNIGRVLVVEAEILLYVLLIGAPFALVAVLLWTTRRSLRRRSEEQLLAR